MLRTAIKDPHSEKPDISSMMPTSVSFDARCRAKARFRATGSNMWRLDLIKPWYAFQNSSFMGSPMVGRDKIAKWAISHLGIPVELPFLVHDNSAFYIGVFRWFVKWNLAFLPIE